MNPGRRAIQVDWEREVWVLRDMSYMAFHNHRLAAESFTNAMASAESDAENGVRDQKILMARLAAEAMGALEDLGALALAIGNRFESGILRHYLTYEPKHVRRLYEAIRVDRQIANHLNLVTALLNPSDRATMASALKGLDEVFVVAADGYLANDGGLIVAHGKLKHGFVVVQRLDKLAPGDPPTNWQQDVNIVTA